MNDNGRIKERLVVELPAELTAWLMQHCEKNGHTITWVITKIISAYRNQVASRATK